MPCTCLSRKRKERSPSNPPPQTDLTLQATPSCEYVPEPSSPFLKLGRLTLLARIERAFNSSQVEEKMELPPPIRPESIVGFSLDPVPTYENYPPDAKESYLQETPGLHEMMPKHPNSAGLIRRSCGAIPKKLVLDMRPETRTHSLITSSKTRKSQYAVVLEASHPLIQPPISPEPTPTFDKSNSQFQQGFHCSNHSMSSTQSTGFSTSNSIPQYATVLRPRLGELLTPPLTPPPNVPLPPIPAASPSTTWPQRTYSLSMTSRPPSTKGLVRDFPYPQDFHPAVLDTVPPTSRPRSKSSPLRSEMKPTSSHAALPTSRRMRFLSSPYSFNSDSEITDETNPTSEEGEPNHIPIALFESTYSPPLPPPNIQNLLHKYHPSTRFSSQKLPNLENLQTCHDFSS
ncbi:hypothetical protein, variant [Puccinia striiformis f. sp. tritici PST-78]|uniref:Uncharacterized protein n=1 Tax=Puccinia striiformis f. sp. tritici PST-78 TaxID=1165861 RepID=A0A0L0UXU3_9BASI|nr:hypothetical protein, variant [Puccinia striiformis f. sp. tritici PST-78]